MTIRRLSMMLALLIGTAVPGEAQQTDTLFTLQAGPVTAAPVGVIEAIPLEPVTTVPNARICWSLKYRFGPERLVWIRPGLDSVTPKLSSTLPSRHTTTSPAVSSGT